MFRELGTRNTAATTPATAIGTLTRKTEPHQKWASNHPPTMGPAATPKPVVPDQIPMARARSRSLVKTLERMDSVEGMIPAAPTPMQARAITRRSGVPENADPADPAANTASPARKIHFLPTLSPRLPSTRRRPANTTAYASTVHCSWLEVACRASHDRRHRHVEDGGVQADHQEADTQHREDDPASYPGHGLRCRTGRAGRGSPLVPLLETGHGPSLRQWPSSPVGPWTFSVLRAPLIR